MNPKYVAECSICEISDEVKIDLCPYCMAQKVIKGKWKLLIFWHLEKETKRFNELSRLIPATQTTLTRQLKELENDQVVQRTVYHVIPPKVEYSLTPLGEKFYEVIKSMGNWGLAYFQANDMMTEVEPN